MRNREPLHRDGPPAVLHAGVRAGFRQQRAQGAVHVHHGSRSVQGTGRTCRRPGAESEFVLLHGDNVDASGFVQHIKLPHYVDFQADLSLIRGLRAKRQNDKDI